MQTALLYPQEIEVFYIIPALRCHFAKYLKSLGNSQKEIAKMLMVRESTVSQYMTAKRATKITFQKEIEKEIQKSAAKIKSHLDIIRETQRILTQMRSSGNICALHKQLAKIPLHCNHQEMGCSIPLKNEEQ